MSEEKGKVVQLHSEELEQMRKIVRAAEENLREVAKTVRDKVGGAAANSRSRVRSARFVFDNIRVVIDDESGCSVYEDPPGVCRPCRPGE
jgi:hypothetical protein